MSHHKLRIYLEPPKVDAETVIDNWIQDYSDSSHNASTDNLREATTGLGENGTKYVVGSYLFHHHTSVTTLLDDLESELQSFGNEVWYRIGYHECDHDEDDRTGCSWEKVRSGGSVPNSVPTINT